MPRYEYKVVAAPNKGLKGKNIKGAEARFSHALQELMNGLAGYGWEYQRAETLPSIERAGLTGTTTEWRNVLVFRRLRDNNGEGFSPELLPAPHEFDGDPAPVQKTETTGSQGDLSPTANEADQDTPTIAAALVSSMALRRKKPADKGTADAAPEEDAPSQAPEDSAPDTSAQVDQPPLKSKD